ncbi:pyrroline-5-carboxylate reductase [Rhizobium leguminosarum]|uniref:pyrroline-5-carboxylate reductase n=1 Tax=Rhizobium leguminosarum TaxID=384 RepID=UPI001441359E|nr:pyrroline-5-carboxylate reductase [Rhizobium leguminosarum]NKK66345.1 pyrroline-5-carboxylate reductase [Rhizobium leguminosarum bv. viciae]NKL09243.1 pyrroline-5-carboxylate reductase [Rhizobium leguminosarum bv. viciae]NKL87885.1 pyrroline-5-carboxylate reductase [Rhizobium leguminosarum bv. viciae]NKL93714.1 pyrroline-5-carboxylate reductase [Rhizobium leguminosarum bv. viciae]NKM95203.1 pyrroline-5-carboxylate reductase [Rhizobium leguminosarum bv. viciae]
MPTKAFSSTHPVVLIGAGNMGGAMLSGWLKSGVPGSSVIVVDPGPSPAMLSTISEAGATHLTALPTDLKASVLFLAVKPQVMEAVLPVVKSAVGPDTVVVSVAAGKTLGFLEKHLGKAAMVRAMPNTPAMVGRGVTGAFANSGVSDPQRERVHALLRVSGPVEWVPAEADIDAVTALSGSGPAYVFYLVECMAEAGRKLGLQADLAMRLARETVAGAGELMHQSPDDASRLRENVTSPGGTTAAALAVLMAEDGMQPLFDAALAAARKRAEELAV